MRIFPFPPPPLEVIADHAGLFTKRDRAVISSAIRALRRGFPQIHWRVVTANLGKDENIGLFSFWLLNVSPAGRDEDISLRPWTVLLVILADGDVAVVPGYAAEVWLSGHDWSRLLWDLYADLKRRKHGSAIRNFLHASSEFLRNSWLRAKGRTRGKMTTESAKKS